MEPNLEIRNVIDVDIDLHVKCAEHKEKAVGVLFDFKAAFPSVNHRFIWSVLSWVGLPPFWISHSSVMHL